MRAALVSGVSLLVLPLALGAPPARALDAGEVLLAEWDFGEAADALGWTALHAVAPLTVREGALYAETTASDPYIASPLLQAETSPNQLLRITVRSTVSGGGQLFWAAAEHGQAGGFNAMDAVGFSVRAGAWQTISLVPGWRAGLALSRLRIDSPEGVGEALEIRRVELVERPVPTDLPATPSYTFTQPGLALAFLPGPGMKSVRGEEDRLVLETEGDPALAYSPRFEVKAEEAPFACLTLRVSAAATVELLIRRQGVSPLPPGEAILVPVHSGGAFQGLNLDLRRIPEYRGGVEGLAIRVSDAAPGTRVEIRSLALVDRPRGPAALDIAAWRVPAVSLLGPTLDLTCEIANHGGAGSQESSVTLTTTPDITGGKESKAVAPGLQPMQRATVKLSVPVSPDFKGGPVSLRLALSEGPESARMTCLVPSPGGALLAGTPERSVDATLSAEGHALLRNGLLTAVFPALPSGHGPGMLFDTASGAPVRLGSFPSLGLVCGREGRTPMRTTDKPLAASGPAGAELVFPVEVPLAAGVRRGRVRYRMLPGAAELECELRLDEGSAAELSGLIFPDFLAGDGAFGQERDLGLFPGLEYLLRGERSSAPTFVAPPDSDRFAPHPYKVTIPAMWVTADGRSVGLRWDPLAEWSPGCGAPTPLFLSPDSLEPGDGHRFGLLAPGVLAGGEENALTVEPAAKVGAERRVVLGAAIFAVAGEDVEAPLRYVLSRMDATGAANPPAPPEPAPSLETVVRRAAHGLAHTVWIPEDRWWHPNLPDAHGPRYTDAFAHVLWLYARAHPEDALGQESAAVHGEAVQARREASQGLGLMEALHEGGADGELRGLRNHARGLAASLRADGSWPYAPQSDLQRSFGVEGDSSSGQTAALAYRCLSLGALTLDPQPIEAGLKALTYLDTQARPEGAQVWELHLHVPDILAAASCVRAYCLAYRLTGDMAYLRSARTWAWRGMPFVYLWNAPDRPVMRYGSIPVFGATHFTGSWFGRIVQWNGLEYADALLDLEAVDDSFNWRAVAEGIVLSAGQQMRPLPDEKAPLAEAVPDCGHPGLYPDAYSAVEGSDAYHWCLEPSRLGLLATRLAGPGALRTEVARAETGVVSVTGISEVTDLAATAAGLTASVFTPAEFGSVTVVVAGFAEVTRVSVNGEALPAVESVDSAAGPCYALVAESDAVVVRLVGSSEAVALSVEGPLRPFNRASGAAGVS